MKNNKFWVILLPILLALVSKHQYGEGATQMQMVTLEKIAFGNLNGDGIGDAAVILAWQNGGSGTFKTVLFCMRINCN